MNRKVLTAACGAWGEDESQPAPMMVIRAVDLVPARFCRAPPSRSRLPFVASKLTQRTPDTGSAAAAPELARSTSIGTDDEKALTGGAKAAVLRTGTTAEKKTSCHARASPPPVQRSSSRSAPSQYPGRTTGRILASFVRRSSASSLWSSTSSSEKGSPSAAVPGNGARPFRCLGNQPPRGGPVEGGGFVPASAGVLAVGGPG